MPVTKGLPSLAAALCFLSGVLCQQEYSVTYSSTRICGLKGSFVDIPCTYSYPEPRQVRLTFWHINWYPDTPTDLSLDPRYQGRVEYLGDKVGNCTLRIKDLKESDSKETYRFRFRTDDPKGQFSGSELPLSLTDLHVTESFESLKEGDSATLTCSTTCSLSNNPTYIWYRNSQPLSNSHTNSSNTLIITSVSKENAGHYSCAVRGHEGHPSPSVCVLCQQEYSVTYASASICGLKGSFVDIPCTYSYPSDLKVRQTFWHINWYPDTPTDLSLDPRYQGRVEYLGDKVANCTLRIKDLKESDSKERYRFRFRTDDPKGQFSGSETSVSLTDLQVTVSPESVKAGNRVTLTCSATCRLSTNPTYIWYRNSQPLSDSLITSSNTLTITSVSKEDSGQYHCAVRGHEDHPSPSVCVLCQQYTVTYSSTRICGLKGSFVDIHCTYSYPEPRQIGQTFWHINWYPDTITDLSLDPRYQGRVEYLGDKVGNCTLRIKDLKESDCKETYRFRFRTDDPKGQFSGSELPLSLTGLYLQVNPTTVMEGNNVTLTCNTTCSLSNNPTYIWYRNSQPVNDLHSSNNRLAIDSARPEDAGQYSCAVKGHKTHSSPLVVLRVTYAPRNTLASVHPSGDLVVGSLVTLTCGSDANPPAHNYSWFKMTGDQQFSQVGSGQNYSIAHMGPEQSGHYYCVAENNIGQNRSPDLWINVENTCWIPVVIAVIGGLLTGLPTGAVIGITVYKKMTPTREANNVGTGAVRGTPAAASQDTGDETYTSLDPRTISSDYDTLANVKVSAGGATYSSKTITTTPAPLEALDYENY